MKSTRFLRLVCAGSLASLLATPFVCADLVGYWNFNEGTGTTVADLSPNNYDGTLIKGGAPATTPPDLTWPYWVAGWSGNPGDYAIDFQGYNDRVEIPIGSTMSGVSAFTIAFWADADYLGSYVYPFMISTDGGGGARTWFIQSDNYGGDQMYVWSDPSPAWREALGFKVGGGGDAYAWHHYAFTYSGGVMSSYVDGTFKSNYTITDSPSLPDFAHILIGGRIFDWTSWEGPIDDVVFFNSVEDVASIMAGTHPAMISSGTAYDTWADNRGLTGEAGSATDPAFDADPELDGVDNGFEWILGGDPLASDPSVLPTGTYDEIDGLTLNFTREEDSMGVATLIVEFGTDLATWPKTATIGATSSAADVNGVTVDIDTDATPDAVTVKIPASNASGGKIFARLQATMP